MSSWAPDELTRPLYNSMPSPGAVSKSTVWLFLKTYVSFFMSMTPATPNTMMRSGWLMASLNEPGPLLLRFVTR